MTSELIERIPDDVDRMIDDLLARHPERAKQALIRPELQGWFSTQVLRQFDFGGSYADMAARVSDRLATLRALASAKQGGEG